MNTDIMAANEKAARLLAAHNNRIAEQEAIRARRERLNGVGRIAKDRIMAILKACGITGIGVYGFTVWEKDQTFIVGFTYTAYPDMPLPVIAVFKARHNEDASAIWLEMDGQRLTDDEAAAVVINAIPE